MFAAQFQTSGQAEQELFGHVAGANNFDDARLTGGDGTGLIQQHSVGVAGGFEAGGGLEQNAVLGTDAAAHHDGDRGGQAQGTGAADDQHADTACQREREGLAQQQPNQERCGGNADDGGNEDAGNFIGRLGKRGLGSGGVAHQTDDLGQRRVLADAFGTAGQGTVLVDGGGADRRAGKLVHRHALAGQGGLVHGGNALGDRAVHRDALAGADQEQVADIDLADRDCDLLAVAQHTGGLRGQLHQTFQRVGGLALAVCFQRFAHGDQGQDHGR